MKKYIFIPLLFISVIALGQNTKYYIITDDIRFVADTIIGGSHYCGWVNSKGKPTAIGTKQLSNNINYKGEWANGLPTGFGYMTAPGTSYSGQIKNSKMSGYGTLTVSGGHSTSGLWENNAIVENSLQFSSEGAFILSQGGKKQQPAREYYEKVFYENQKADIKNKVQAQGVRYVEDFEITHKSDIYLYSGGWKDGKPFYYGAIKNTNSWGVSAYVKCGYIHSVYTSGENVGLPHFEGEYNEYSYDNGLITKKLTDKGDTIFSQMTKYIRYFKITNSNNDITKLDIVNTYNRVAIHSLCNSDSIGVWSICYEPNTLHEGYVNRDGVVISTGGRSIDTDGEFREDNTIRYANHSLFTVIDTLIYEENISDILFGVYTQENKDYAIGYFTRRFQNSHKDYPAYLTPIAVKEYFSDDETKKDILSSNRDYQRKGEPLANDQWQKRILKYCDMQRTPISGSATYNFSDGTVYNGEWLNHAPEGKGMMQYPNGDTYQGFFSQGKPNGEGKMQYTNGDVIQGNFVQGLLDGEGVIQYANGNIYKGTFSKGTLNGEGTIQYVDGSVYEGVFSQGILNGEGMIQYADGSIYKGTFNKGVLNGEGMIQYADSDIYQGHISSGHPFGNGIIRIKNGGSITGVWENKKLIQATSITTADGVVINGTLQSGEFSGETTILFNDSSSYIGMVEQNAYRGFGTYRFANGDQIETIWGIIQENKVQSNSQQSGGFFRDLVSTMLGVDIPSKTSKENTNSALLVNNNDITYLWADGRKFIGTIKNGTLGEGTYYLADGTKASKKEYKKWVVQQPVALSITMPASENIIL